MAGYGLPLAVYYNQPGAYDGDGEFPFFLLGWFGGLLVLVGAAGLIVIFRFRRRLWRGAPVEPLR